MSLIHSDDLVDVTELANLFGLTTRRVQQLAQESVIPKAERGRYPLMPSIEAYIRFLRDALEGSGVARDLSGEKAALAREQRIHTELRNQQLRGELVSAGAAVRTLQALAGAMKNRLSGVHAVMQQRHGDIPPVWAATLRELIDDALRQVATDGLPAEYRTAVPGGDGHTAAVAQDDPIGVG